MDGDYYPGSQSTILIRANRTFRLGVRALLERLRRTPETLRMLFANGDLRTICEQFANNSICRFSHLSK